MKIALLGYGKMGKEIEAIAINRGHEIVLKIAIENASELTKESLQKADVAIEFSTPETAFENINKCFDADIPVVVGTTGWLEKIQEVKARCNRENKSFFYASNYSVGVNIFFLLNKHLARIMNSHEEYDIELEEIHHTQKLDAPSGTAITIANDVLDNLKRKKNWSCLKVSAFNAKDLITPKPEELIIKSIREENVPGIHSVTYSSSVDSIEIKHHAFSRKGFAAGAVAAAEWIIGKKGIFGMEDLLNLKDNNN